MYGQGLSDTAALERWPLTRMLLSCLLVISGCSDLPPTSPEVTDPAEPTLNLDTGNRMALPFDAWLCGDEFGRQLGYVFDSVVIEPSMGGTGEEVVLAEQRAETFTWTAPTPNAVQLDFVDMNVRVHWRHIQTGKASEMRVQDDRHGLLRCVRERLMVPSGQPAPDATAVNDSVQERALAEYGQMNAERPSAGDEPSPQQQSGRLTGKAPGNPVSVLEAAASGDLSIWLCEGAAGPFALTFLMPEAQGVQGQVLDSRGINAVRFGRWMWLASDVLRLDLAEQGEVIIADLIFDGPDRLTATSDRDGPTVCRLEPLAWPVSSAAT